MLVFVTTFLPAVGEAAGAADMATAEALFQEARGLMEVGKYATACPKLAESQRLDPAVGTLLYLAECYEKNGQTASAWASFELAAAEGRKDKQAERELIAKERAFRLLPVLSRLVISVPAKAVEQGLKVTYDGQSVGAPSWESDIPVDPGKHVIVATAPGRQPWVTEIVIQANNGTTRIVIPTLDKSSSSTDTPAAGDKLSPKATLPKPIEKKNTSQSATNNSNANYWKAQRVWGASVGGVGLATVAVGTLLSITGKNKEDDAEKKYCVPADPNQCSQKGADLIHEATNERTAGLVMIIVGTSAIIGGGILFFATPSTEHPYNGMKSARPKFNLTVEPTGGIGLLYSGRFY